MGPYLFSPAKSKKQARLFKILFLVGLLAGISMICFGIYVDTGTHDIKYLWVLIPGVFISAFCGVMGFHYCLVN
jgi:hypothetical protein